MESFLFTFFRRLPHPPSLCPPRLEAQTGEFPHRLPAQPHRAFPRPNAAAGPFPSWARGKDPGPGLAPFKDVRPTSLVFLSLLPASDFPISSIFLFLAPGAVYLLLASHWAAPPYGTRAHLFLRPLSTRTHPSAGPSGVACTSASKAPAEPPWGSSPGGRPHSLPGALPQAVSIQLRVAQLHKHNSPHIGCEGKVRVSLFCLELIWSFSSEPHPLVSGLGRIN